jgi:O-antigen/teichoic acid export membrane protein
MGIAAGLIYFLYWLLIPIYGMLGGAYATMICFGVFSLLTYVFSIKIYPVYYPLSKFGYVVGIGIGFYLIGSNIFTQVRLLDIIGKGVLTICYPLAVLIAGAIDKNDIYTARKYVCDLRQRFVTTRN